MKKIAALHILAIALSTVSPAVAQGGAPGLDAIPGKRGPWISLFDGKSLAGWAPKIKGYPLGENYRDTFRVVSGAIQVSYAGYERFEERFGHLVYKTPFRSFRLRLKYRFLDPGMPDAPAWAHSNSGIMFHGQPPESMGLKQNFPISLEFQLLGRDGPGPRPTGAVCTPGTTIAIQGVRTKDHCIASKGPTIANGQWIKAELDVLPGGQIIHRINGKVVHRYEQPELDPDDPDAAQLIAARGGSTGLSEGYISLQSEGHPIAFSAIEIQRLE